MSVCAFLFRGGLVFRTCLPKLSGSGLRDRAVAAGKLENNRPVTQTTERRTPSIHYPTSTFQLIGDPRMIEKTPCRTLGHLRLRLLRSLSPPYLRGPG